MSEQAVRPISAGWMGEVREFLRGTLVIAKKDCLIYYLKPPVLIFGVLFPVAFFLAFGIGRELTSAALVVGMLALVLFFTASSVGPLITPWERRSGTYERLLSAPVGVPQLVFGDALAGAGFGLGLSLVAVVVALVATEARLASPLTLVLALVASAFCFSALGVLLAARPSDNPSQIMMLSQLVRLPLIFVSGIFLPLGDMPDWLRAVAYVSPLTYSTDLIRASWGVSAHFPLALDVAVVLVFGLVFLLLARKLHVRVLAKGRL